MVVAAAAVGTGCKYYSSEDVRVAVVVRLSGMDGNVMVVMKLMVWSQCQGGGNGDVVAVVVGWWCCFVTGVNVVRVVYIGAIDWIFE